MRRFGFSVRGDAVDRKKPSGMTDRRDDEQQTHGPSKPLGETGSIDVEHPLESAAMRGPIWSSWSP